MKEAIWKVSPWGDFAFHGICSDQLTLGIEAPNFDPLKESLGQHFRGKGWVDIREVEELVASDQTDYYTGQLRRGALIPMEDDGELAVEATPKRKKHTYPDGTRLRFL